jgi:Na+/H+ antiporter NhaD/arsenite permease-like protein
MFVSLWRFFRATRERIKETRNSKQTRGRPSANKKGFFFGKLKVLFLFLFLFFACGIKNNIKLLD